MKLQPQTSKLAEIKYRSKISKQHLGQEILFPNEPTYQEFTKISRDRLQTSQEAFNNLYKRGFSLSPFLEVGAEYGLRSTLLINKFKARGFAVDIAYPSLAKTKDFAKIFKFKKIPRIVCADANNLPFKSNSFPFIFVYETLHHLPDPTPVIKEIYRVLAPGGTCLIGAEPIKQSLQLKLWRRPNKLRFFEKILKFSLILPFVSHIGKTEVEHGILEEAFTLKTWQKALSIFDKAQVTLMSLGSKKTISKSGSKNWLNAGLPLVISLFFTGGGLEAVLTKEERLINQKTQPKLNSLLICPNCLIKSKREVILSIHKLTNKTIACQICKRQYSQLKGVTILLEDKLKQKILNSQK